MGTLFKGLGGHQTSGETSNEWLTPPEIVRALGPFALDPAATCGMAHESKPWATASRMYCRCVDGTLQEWKGRVWLNPPYDETIGWWLRRMAGHAHGISLTFARTETIWFQEAILGHAIALFFPRGRIRFYKPDGTKGHYTGGAPSVLTAYTNEDALALSRLQMAGKFVRL